jgi:hypothetical protein
MHFCSTGKINNKPRARKIMNQLLTEPAIVPDVFCSGMAEAEDLQDGNWRFTFYAKQKTFSDYSGDVDFIVVARIILPAGAVLSSIQETMKAMGVSCCGAERLRLAH